MYENLLCRVFVVLLSILQVGSMLIARVSNTDMTWHKDVLPSPRSYHQLDLTLDDNTVLKAIEHMNFIQMKSMYIKYLSYARAII